MEQYEKSGPPLKKIPESEKVANEEIKRMAELIGQQSQMITDLQTEIRRIKSKMDAHAAVLNQLKRNG